MSTSYSFFLLTACAGFIANRYATFAYSKNNFNLKISGLIDTGIVSTSHVKNGTTSKTTSADSILGVSNLGFDGLYTIIKKYQFFLKLQTGFKPSKGEQNNEGELFDRNAYIGINSPYGALSLGKQWTFNDDWFVGSVFKGGYHSGALFKFSEFDAVSEIYANLLKYSSPNLNGWPFGLIYGCEDDSAKNSHGPLFSTAFKYSTERWLLGAAYQVHQALETKNHYQLTTLAANYKTKQPVTRLGLAYAVIDAVGQYAPIASNLTTQKAWATELGIDYLRSPKRTLSGDVIYKKNTSFNHYAMVYRGLTTYQFRPALSFIANIAYLKNYPGSSESLVTSDSDLAGGGYANQDQLSTALGNRFSF